MDLASLVTCENIGAFPASAALDGGTVDDVATGVTSGRELADEAAEYSPLQHFVDWFTADGRAAMDADVSKLIESAASRDEDQRLQLEALWSQFDVDVRASIFKESNCIRLSFASAAGSQIGAIDGALALLSIAARAHTLRR